MEKYTPSESILEKIREYEKFVNHWYKDGNGFWTLGYGHKKTLNDTVDNRKISEQQALDLFNNDVNSSGENAQNNGFNPKAKTYRPYRTPNGNLDVANGIDLKKNPKYKKEAQLGISKDRANQIASEVLMPEQKYIDNNLKKYTNYPDTISPQIKEGLLDMYWQLGNGLYKYQNLFNAIANGDISQIREESKVQYKTPAGKWNFDKGRYENRLNEYFHYKFGGIITKRRFI